MSNTWFTADTHFGHRNIIDHCNRPFADVDEMNETLIERWNAVVKPGDTVWFLGDVALGDKHLWPVALLNGTKHLVAGNHDTCWLNPRKKPDKARRMAHKYMDAGFSSVYPGAPPVVQIAGRIASLCHFPYAGDSRDEDRYEGARLKDHGGWLLHGHVHEKWRVNGRMINVGVDVWDFYPVHQDAIEFIIKRGGE